MEKNRGKDSDRVAAILARAALNEEDENPRTHIICQAPVGGIPARVGSTPGKAVCLIVEFDPDNETLTVTTDDVVVYNFTTLIVSEDPPDRYILATRHEDTGTYWVEAEECPPDQALMIFGGEFNDGNTPYAQNTLVTSNGWAQVSNVETSDNPEPFPIGPVIERQPTSPLWAIITVPSGDVQITGQRYTFSTGGFIDLLRFWVPVIGTAQTYELWGRLTRGGLVVALTQLVGAFQATNTGWHSVDYGDKLFLQNDVFELFLVTISGTAPVTWSGNWNKLNSNQSPATGQATQPNNDASTLRMHKTDNDSTDQTANLALVNAGDTMVADGIDFTILDKTDQGAFVEFTIAPATRISTGVQSFEFKVVQSGVIEYVHNVDQFTGDAEVEGLIGIDLDSLTYNQTGYGVDIRQQNADVSADYDFVSYSPEVATPRSAADPVVWTP